MSAKEKELTKEEEDHLQNVINLYSAFDKLVRGIKLYQGKGSLVERLSNEVEKRMNVALEGGEITSKITPIGPVFLGKPVFDDGRPAKYLFQLYCDGVRELSFQPGITSEEILGLADVFNADIGAIEDDMVTLLWKQDFSHIRYYAVDALGAQIDESEDLELLNKSASKLDAIQDGEEMKMSSSDMRLLKAKDSLNWVRICQAPSTAPKSMEKIIDGIQDNWESSQEYSRFIAIALKVTNDESDAPLVEQLFASLALGGNVTGVLEILDCLLKLTEQGLDKAQILLSKICSERGMLHLSSLFEQHSQKFVSVFERLVTVEGVNLEGCVSLLSSLEPGEARSLLQGVLAKSSVDMTAFYLDALEDDNDQIVADAISALGQIGSDRAVSALYKSLGNPLTSIRTAALQAIGGVYLATERKALVKVLKDPDRSNRMLALGILGSVEERSIGPLILGVMQEAAFSKRDEEEQEVYFSILARYPSPSVFGYLDKILADKNITRNKSVTKKQLLVVQTLRDMNSPDVKPMLEKFAKNWFLAGEVKAAIKDGLR